MIGPNRNKPPSFLNKPTETKNKKNSPKIPLLSFPLQNVLRSNNKISSTLAVNCTIFNETKRKNNIHYIDAELAGHVHKLDVKLQSLCGSGISLFVVRVLVKPYHFGVSWPTTLCENKDGVHFFTLKVECHNRYKLLLCNSENGDIAWCNKNNSQWEFCVFFGNRKLFLFLIKQKYPNWKKQKKLGGLFFLKNGFFSTLIAFQSFICDFPLIARSGTSHVTISLFGCAPHT